MYQEKVVEMNQVSSCSYFLYHSEQKKCFLLDGIIDVDGFLLFPLLNLWVQILLPSSFSVWSPSQKVSLIV